MKKLSSIVFVVALLLVSSNLYAKDMAGKFGAGGNWFYYLQNDTDFEEADTDIEGTPIDFNVHLSYCLPHPTEAINVNILLDWEYISRDIVDKDSGDFPDDLGKATLMPLMLGTQIRFANLGIVTPYLGFALGISFNSVKKGGEIEELEEYLERNYPGINFDTEIDVEHSFAFKIPIGMDIHLTDNIALNLEAKYFYTRPELEIKFDYDGRSDNESDEVDLDTFAFGAGINFYF